MTGSAKQSMPLRKERLDCFVAALPCANASRLSQAMTKEPLRHCEPTGRANARPMTGSAKQSMPLRHCERSEAIHAARKNGLLRRCAPRNDSVTSPSLRATGSRECAPDDRLREARSKGLDCFVAEPVIGLAEGETRWLPTKNIENNPMQSSRRRFGPILDTSGKATALLHDRTIR